MLIDIAQLSLMLLTSAIIAGAFIALARSMRLERFVATPRRGGSPAETIDLLAGVAETIASRGLVPAEASVDATRQPLLKRGLELIIEGHSADQIRAALQPQDISTASPGLSSLRTRTLASGVVLVAAGLVFAGLIAGVLVASGQPSGGLIMLVAVGVTLCALPALSWAAMRVDRPGAIDPATELSRLMTIHGIGLIASDTSPSTIRTELMKFLPPSQRRIPAPPIAKAA